MLLVLIVPLLVISALRLADILRFRQEESKALKIAYAVSESELARYSAYLAKNYSIFACLDRSETASFLKYYLDANRIEMPPGGLGVTYERLSDPALFREAVIDAALRTVVREAADFVRTRLADTELGGRIGDAIESIGQAERKLTEFFDDPGSLRKIRAGLSGADLRRALDDLEREVASQSEAFSRALPAARVLLSDLPEGELRDLRSESFDELDAEFRSRIEALGEFAEEARTLADELESQESEHDRLMETLRDLEYELSPPVADDEAPPRDPDEIAWLVSEIGLLRERIEETEDRIEDLRDRLGQTIQRSVPRAELGLFRRFTASLARFSENWKSLFAAVTCEEGALILDPRFAYRPEDLRTAGAFHEKILIGEWAAAVFGSYDKNCPRKLRPRREKGPIRGELEYLLTGEPLERLSLAQIKVKLTGIRLAANLISAAANPSLMREIRAATMPIPLPFRTAARGAAYTAVCVAESWADVQKLLRGHGLPLVKCSGDWAVSWENLTSGSFGSAGTPDKPSGPFDPRMYYLDHLRILLAAQSENRTVTRAMNLIGADLLHRTRGSVTLGSFSIGHEISFRWVHKGLFRTGESELKLRNSYRRGSE